MRQMMNVKCYSELKRLTTFEERFRYLKLHGKVGADTFGADRVFNQMFYTSAEWKRIRHFIITRDMGCDLGAPGHDIYGPIYIHHMNPITEEDLDSRNPDILDPEFLIAVSHETHNAIHFGLDRPPIPTFVERRPNDMIPWR